MQHHDAQGRVYKGRGRASAGRSGLHLLTRLETACVRCQNAQRRTATEALVPGI
jgi:hypothetical protein